MKTESEGRIATPEQLIGETARAIGFLSRIPVPARFFADEEEKLSAAARTFPLAGIVIALPAAALIALLDAIHAPPLVAGLLVVALQAAVTGALHEDGLADTADGLGGGREPARALSIMKDSRIGVFGAVALMLTLGLRAAAYAALAAGAPPIAAALSLVGVAAASRAAMVWHWQALGSARESGVAAAQGIPTETAANWAIGVGVAVLGICVLPALGALPAVAALTAAGLATAFLTRHVSDRIGGHTGDTIGATQQIAEAGALVALILTI
ncbi:MAG: adenosylcobinamide-GDP ribazoletransferase [Pararhizobium sp.]